MSRDKAGSSLSRDKAESSLSPVRRVTVIRVTPDGTGTHQDLAAAEEPLEVRLHGRSFAVIMRTPGDDRALAAGFLLSERVVRSADDLGAVEHCRHPDHPDVHHVVDVFLRGRAAEEAARHLDERRRVVANSSCGLCGRTTIEGLRADTGPLPIEWTMDRAVVRDLPTALRTRQSMFAETGGLHAAGLFDRAGTLLRAAEDIGRHNAVDKVIGGMLLDDRLPLGDTVLMVSGRVSFEIVQKAWLAGIPLVAAISAPSSLAVELSGEAGITLLGFVRDGSFNVYTHESRLEGM